MKSLCEKCLYPNVDNCPAEYWQIEYNSIPKNIVSQCDMFDDGKQNEEKYPDYPCKGYCE